MRVSEAVSRSAWARRRRPAVPVPSPLPQFAPPSEEAAAISARALDEAHRREGEQLRRLRMIADEVRLAVARERGILPAEFELLERIRGERR